MQSLTETFEIEYNKAILKPGIKTVFIENKFEDMKQIFGYLFIVNYFKNRVETKHFFGPEFNIVYSLLLESVYALYTGQCRSALLLLRSTQEANFRHVLLKEREWIHSFNTDQQFESLNFRFVESSTLRKFKSACSKYRLFLTCNRRYNSE